MSLAAAARARAARLRARVSDLLARRDEVVGINRRNLALVYPENPRRHYPLADDKLLAKERFAAAGVPVAATLAVCDGLFAVPAAVEALRGRGRFVVKPANGSGGGGIVVVGDWDPERGAWRRAGGEELRPVELARHLADVVFGVYSNQLEDRAFVEERIVPHPLFAALWADGLCDVRVITLRGEPLMAMIRVPTAESGGRANLHQGGLGIAVGLGTGRTFRALHHGRAVERHPESGTPLLELAVPDWAGILSVARRAAGAVPLGYLGVDVVVDRARGPLVLEINARPGLEIQNVNGRGLWPAVAPVRAAGDDEARPAPTFDAGGLAGDAP
ncbi:sugar-transfer associated ATP-grasp domain-containing protein [Anaeromyxobacter oryzisoli]|uniref:sugar-transfer associated ATP-grasp domain-containing protein n=1 Tax=Anaeromyxobacter oryzisoli TaxID=2925408 RepID=UPI001F580CE1|nr:sugar-transfer associated ATP-grasp domain-containing protein [Anaeromyxobacter sp. SG63]